MRPKELRWLFLVVIIAIIVIGSVSEPTTLGLSAGTINGSYHYAAGTHPLALIVSVVTAGLYFLLTEPSTEIPQQPLPGVLRRYMAFWLDFILAITITTPIIGLIPVLAEWRRTHLFQWTFERTIPAAGDQIVIGAVMLLMFSALVLYYAIPLMRCKPSPGSCIVGYQIIADDNKRLALKAAVLRALLGFLSVATFYVAPFIARDRKRGKFWLDKVFKTRAVRIS